MNLSLVIVSLLLVTLQFSSCLANSEYIYKKTDVAPRQIPGQGHKEAFVTLLYSDSFVLPVRVLGHSLQKTGTKRCEL
jgi:hypothetical protein